MLKNKELELAWNFIQYTDRNIFLTGNAGTGKTTFLRELKQKSHKRIIVTAPTGVAAINAGGVTLHSFFQLPFGPILTETVTGQRPTNQEPAFKFNKKKINIIKTLDILVIDEISMVRADMLDAIDEVLRKYRNRNKPFGGVQLLMIGDLEQLSPVIKPNEWNLLKPYYPSIYFFHSKAAINSNLITIELKHIYRQADEKFIGILNEIRNNYLSSNSLELLNSRYKPNFEPTEEDEYIMLTTHNSTADSINKKRLEKIKGKEYSFKASVSGTFNEYSYPTEFDLKLKVSSQVMFVKNDSSYEKRYFNGKIGKITEINHEGEIYVQCEGDDEPILTNQELWENIKYTLDDKSGELKEESVGSFSQYPLRLAWAITIHKSQGLTFEKAIIDAEAAFAHGQTYVALSRCKTLEGMILSSKIGDSAIISDQKVSDFNEKMKENPPQEKDLLESKYKYQKEIIFEIFNYRQLRYRIDKLEGILLDNHKVIFGKLSESVHEIQKVVLTELNGIATKFLSQLNQILAESPDAETNTFFAERIKKASAYFIEQHDKRIILPLSEGYETDNKELKKQIEEQLAAINEVLNIRQFMLKACLSGFNINNILKARTEGTLQSEIKKKNSRKTTVLETQHPELYSLIKYWRDETARTEGLAYNQILLQKTMIEISNKLPQTLVQLKKVSGVGKVKIRDYGVEIIELVQEYLETKGIRKDTPIEIKKLKKEKSEDITWQLIKSGKKIEEAAKERNLAITTIESHIIKCIDKEDFNFQDFIGKDKILEIMDFYHDKTDATLSEAKSNLGESTSWFELKLVNAIRLKINGESDK